MKRLVFGLAVLAALCVVAHGQGLSSAATRCDPPCTDGLVCAWTGMSDVANPYQCVYDTPVMGAPTDGGSDAGAGAGGDDGCGNKCSSAQMCLFGQCVDSAKVSTCTPACNPQAGEMCFFGSCYIAARREEAGYLLGECVHGGCNVTSLTCMHNHCFPVQMTNLIPKCKSNAQCGDNLRCDVATGSCLPFEAPALDCGGKCASGESCFYGHCLPTLVERACTPACNASWGQTCHPLLGMCVANSTRSDACGDCGNNGECEPSASFLGVAPTCLGSTCTYGAVSSVCSGGSFCRQTGSGIARCQTCIGACRDLRRSLGGGEGRVDDFLTMLAAVGISSAATVVNKTAAAAAAMANAGVLQLGDDTVMDLDSSAQVQTLRMSAATAAAARVSSNMRVDSVHVTSANNRLLLNDDAQLVARKLEVAQGGVLTLALPYLAYASLNVSELSLNGQLNILGGSSSRRERAQLIFPSTAAASASSSSSGLVQLATDANVVVGGHAGAVNWALSRSADIETSADAPVVLGGNVYGVQGELNLYGDVTLAGRTIEAPIFLKRDSTLRVDTTKATGAQRLAQLRFDSYVNEASTLEISGTTSAGSDLYFESLFNCPPLATVRYNVQGNARAAVNAGMTLFNYGAKTWARFSHSGTDTSFSCRISVCGTEGGCVNIRNPLDARDNAGSSSSASAAGRRLLAAEEVELTATWEPTRLSVSGNGEGSKGDGSAAAGVTAQPLLLLALVFAAMIAMLRM